MTRKNFLFFPFSLRYIVACYFVDVLALVGMVFVAHLLGFDAGRVWAEVRGVA